MGDGRYVVLSPRNLGERENASPGEEQEGRKVRKPGKQLSSVRFVRFAIGFGRLRPKGALGSLSPLFEWIIISAI